MKLIATKYNLQEVFQTVERFTGKNLSLPVLGNIFFEADQQKARCVATNLEMGIEMNIPCKVVKNGSVVIPGKFAASIMHSVHDDMVTLEEQGGVVSFTTESSHFSLNGASGGDFPLLPKIKHEHKFSASARDFSLCLSGALPSVSVSDLRPELSGVFFKKDAQSLTIAATDSFRLAERTIPLSSSGDTGSFIVPGRTCQEVLRAISNYDGELHMSSGESHIAFEFSGSHIISRLIDGAYPDYAAIIPNDFSTHMTAPREELVKKIRAASVLSSKLNDIVFSFMEGEAPFLETANSEVGKSHIQFPATVKGKGGRVSFNFRYLLDGLEAVSGKEVTVSLNGDSAPAMIRDSEAPSFRYVLMPIRSV